jgi:HD-like signal output (HDOD) protein
MLIVLLVPAGIVLWLSKPNPRARVEEGKSTGSADSAATQSLPDAEQIPFSTEAIDAAVAEGFKLAFGVQRFDYQIRDEHAIVLDRIDEAADQSVHQRDYFPRRPMLLPKLMQALNDPEVSRETLVKLILEDPAIAGGVLQQANTAFYRVSPARVDNIDRAVWLLGTDGLRRLMATAIMQPVFRMPKGYFDSFAPLTWEQAQRAAAAAECYAKLNRGCDQFIAQLLAVLQPLARIVIFRLTNEKYRESPNIMPRAEVFIRAMRRHSSHVALRIANAWEMSDESVAVLRDQAQHVSPSQMNELSRGVYFANLAGALAIVAARKAESLEAAIVTLIGQGLEQEQAAKMMSAALSSQELR